MWAEGEQSYSRTFKPVDLLNIFGSSKIRGIPPGVVSFFL